MYAFPPHTVMHAINYQANSQFHPAQNQLFFNGSPTNVHQDFMHYNRNGFNYNKRQTQVSSVIIANMTNMLFYFISFLILENFILVTNILIICFVEV